MKILKFLVIKWGKLSELEPEPEFLTSWSRSWSRTKMDRLRNTVWHDDLKLMVGCDKYLFEQGKRSPDTPRR
jgi:hypothetical protein